MIQTRRLLLGGITAALATGLFLAPQPARAHDDCDDGYRHWRYRRVYFRDDCYRPRRVKIVHKHQCGRCHRHFHSWRALHVHVRRCG